MKDIFGYWNYYLLRYGVPSIVGGYIVILLIEQNAVPCCLVPQSLYAMAYKGLNIESAIIFWFLGLAYCYIASAPILLIHALRGICSSEGTVYSFYVKLSGARSHGLHDKDKKGNKDSEYVESYRHLREHGNAFAIIFFEVFLAVLLFWCGPCDCKFIIIYLFLWIMMGAIVWIIATYLEFQIIKKK